MGKKLKAGTSGESCKFISRAKAIRKLQVSLKDFRRLCILKGVFPREPPQKLKQKHLSYYHVKDINFLMHDRIIQKFRDIKSHIKKIKKAKVRGRELQAKKLTKNTPKYTLNHLVKERYPSFTDALRDLDDPLCLINLFAALHAHKEFGIPRETIEKCIKLSREFNLFVIKSKSLRKTFLSIKGIYYQAEIQGQQITWIQPFHLPSNLPVDVDYKVMITFYEFYETLVKFVNFKLFAEMNIKYPLEIDSSIENENHFCYKSYIVKNNEGNLFDEENQKYKIDEKFQKEIEQQTSDFPGKDLFKDLVFFLSTEVPKYSLEFVILSFGGQVYWAGDESGVKADDKKITHYITDRKPEQIKFLKNREYIQPQWIYDSVNNAILLPIKDYSPGKLLPPHLSPFEQSLYQPERQKEINQLKGEANEQLEEEDEAEIKRLLEEEQNGLNSDDEEEEDEDIKEEQNLDEIEDEEEEEEQEENEEDEEEDEEEDSESSEEEEIESEQLSSEIVDEVKGGDDDEEDEEEEGDDKQYDFQKEKQKQATKGKKLAKEQKELAKTMMSKKDKTLYRIMNHKKQKAQQEAAKLIAKQERIKRKDEFLNKRKNQPKQALK
ncbi:BRCT domain [Pseudocohnilembus persalinus]|uniref:Pescadillo homolog n=1 Tax=Pseudocohnilembus persalinus TaxID=266149 RepID=A0A0V0QHA5_PSEPJ|nr:BRCT domain [Pseudocohnilembus persalinus]|eukprot:KRX01530.1 BRCT domain [Pseudocohnilembus persalinus]